MRNLLPLELLSDIRIVPLGYIASRIHNFHLLDRTLVSLVKGVVELPGEFQPSPVKTPPPVSRPKSGTRVEEDCLSGRLNGK